MSKTPWYQLLFNKRMLLILVLGFVSGLPLGLTASTLQAWYAMDGVSVVTIGFLALVGQPYVYKFIWSPILDKWRLPFLGLRRGWMLVTQLGLIGLLCWMAMMSPQQDPIFLAFLALCLAFMSATQDIAIDAYRTELLTVEERGMGTAMAVSGYRIAMLVSSGLSLILAQFLGFSVTYLIMAGLMSLGVIATLLAKEPITYRPPSANFIAAFTEPFKEFFNRRHAVMLLLFIILYKLGDAFAITLTTAFLLKGVGFTLMEIGLINKTIGLGATLLGVLVGGILMIRVRLFYALMIFGVIQALTNLLFFALAKMGVNQMMLIITVFLENFGGGLGTAAFMALVMSLCNPRFTATQFALLSSLSAIGRVFVGPAAGYIVEAVGWSEFFLWTVVFALPGLFILWFLRRTIDGYGAKNEEAVEEGIQEAKASA